MAKDKITKKFVDSLSHDRKGHLFFWDTDLLGFGIRITAGAKTYVAQKRVNGKTVRVTIGRHGQLTPEMARKRAQEFLSSMTFGNNPVVQKKEARAKSATLEEALVDFLNSRTSLKPRTAADYRYRMEKHFGDWLNKPLREITRDLVEARHKSLGKTNGPSTANLAFRYLRAIINFARDRYVDSKGIPIIQDNPIRRLARSWFPVERRRTYIKDSELELFFDGLDSLKTSGESNRKSSFLVADYLEFVLLTGLRKNEAGALKWSDVDLYSKSFTIRETKNGEPLTLPMSSRVFEIISNRHKVGLSSSFYVFPGHGNLGHLKEPKWQLRKVSQISGVEFTIHDLRRTFATVAASLNIDGYTIKSLLNHKQKSDVTQGYIIHDVERLRKPMEAISDAILTRSGRRKLAQVIPFRQPMPDKG